VCVCVCARAHYGSKVYVIKGELLRLEVKWHICFGPFLTVTKLNNYLLERVHLAKNVTVECVFIWFTSVLSSWLPISDLLVFKT